VIDFLVSFVRYYPPMDLTLIALTSFSYVFLRAFQQLNVQSYSYFLILPTSMCMALGDVFLVTNYARHGVGWALVLIVGVSSGIGSVAAMYARRKWVPSR
jgi:glucose uptake protein GlcU